MRQRILVIEDEPAVSRGVRDALSFHGYAVDVAADGDQGYRLARDQGFDLIILDLMLPRLPGLEVLSRLRDEQVHTPVVILTARGQEGDRVAGLELGADDYVVKPFSHMELLARVKAVLRRSQMPELRGDEKPFVHGKLKVDFSSREITVGGNPVKLTPIEYNLLYQMIRNEGRVLTHRFLLEKVWGEEYIDATDYLKKYIQRLRQKLEDDSENPRLILTERGVGYKLMKPQ